MVREMFNCSARAGMYVPVRDLLSSLTGGNEGETHMGHRILAAVVTGTLGAVVSNPVDVVKVRLLADQHRYPSTYSVRPTQQLPHHTHHPVHNLNNLNIAQM